MSIGRSIDLLAPVIWGPDNRARVYSPTGFLVTVGEKVSGYFDWEIPMLRDEDVAFPDVAAPFFFCRAQGSDSLLDKDLGISLCTDGSGWMARCVREVPFSTDGTGLVKCQCQWLKEDALVPDVVVQA